MFTLILFHIGNQNFVKFSIWLKYLNILVVVPVFLLLTDYFFFLILLKDYLSWLCINFFSLRLKIDFLCHETVAYIGSREGQDVRALPHWRGCSSPGSSKPYCWARGRPLFYCFPLTSLLLYLLAAWSLIYGTLFLNLLVIVLFYVYWEQTTVSTKTPKFDYFIFSEEWLQF